MNKKIITLIIGLAAVCGRANAQQKQGKAFRPRFTQYGAANVTEIGRSKIRILYAFQAQDLKDEDTWIDCGQLLTDKGMTQYSSFFVSENNAFIRKWQKDNPNKSYYPGSAKLKGRMKDYWSEYQYSQIYVQGKELTEWADIRLNFVATHFRYETLRRIVEEFYMCSGACHNDTWGDDVDGFIRDKCADWFDSYDSAMA